MRSYTFDVFDTCISRTCGKPENIFRLLAEEIVRDKDESMLRAFVRERKLAEKKAMKSFGKEAVTIDEIYDVFNLVLFSDLPKGKIKEREIALEIQSYRPIKSTLDRINELRGKGRIAFISDMYLPDEVIRKALLSFGIMQEGDSLYVSGSVGLSKHTGRLFNHVAEVEGFSKKKWTHHGDNLLSDYFMPKRKGIKAKLIKTDYSEYEAIIHEEAKYFSSPFAASVFAGLMRASRLEGDGKDGGFKADIMAPLIVPFVDALLKDASAKHIKRLYFASRDTYIMYLVAKELSKKYSSVEVRYLHISTKVAYSSSIYKAEKAEIMHILQYAGHFLPGKIMQMFGCTDDEIKEMAKRFDINSELSPKSPGTVEFVEKLLEGDGRIKLQDRCAAKRELFMAYLKQEGFSRDSQGAIGLVDVGWRCTTQEMLQRLVDAPITYYYWGVSDQRISFKHSGLFSTFFYAEDFGKRVFRNKLFIEFYICRTTEGSTLGYKTTAQGIEPVLAAHKSDSMNEEIINNHKFVVNFARKYLQYTCLTTHSEEIHRSLFLRIMNRFTLCPNKEIIGFLHKKIFWRTFYNRNTPFIIKLYPWTIAYIILFYPLRNRFSNILKYRMIWLEGCFIYTYGAFGKWLIWSMERLLASKRLRFLAKCLYSFMK